MSATTRTRDLQPGTVVRVAYHTRKQTYNLEGVVKEDQTDRPGAVVSLEDDPYSPVTVARVYTTHQAWLDARERDGRDAPLPNGFVRERLHAAGSAEGERQPA